jgi:RNA polymerase sigma factor (sigma-70 family)
MSSPDTGPKRPRAADLIGRAYAQYSGELKSFLARRARRTQSSDDLMQEIYVELLRYSPAGEVREPQAYLYKVAWHVVNRYNAQLQREAVPHEPGELDRIASRAVEGRAAGPEARLEAEQRVLRALEALPPLYGAALILSRRDGLSYSQIARELGISAHTVRKYLTRAVAHLKTVRRDE